MSGWLEQFLSYCRKDVVTLMRERTKVEARKAAALERIADNLAPRSYTVRPVGEPSPSEVTE